MKPIRRAPGRLPAAAVACAAGLACCSVSALAQLQPGPVKAKGGYVLQERPAPERAALRAEVQDTLQRINAYRAAGATCGSRRFEAAAPVAWNPLLEQAAQKHAADMAARRNMSHSGGDGSSMSDRVGREAYAWGALGENVSAGYRTVPEALAGWMKSPGHCANMMSPNFREVGVGGASAPGDAFGWYRAMVLGSPAR